MSTTVVFVHGWSVTNLDTYGELPLRLKNEAAAHGLDITVQEIFLGRYISFDDEVTLEDLSTAFDAAVKEQLPGNRRFVCITHSTGAPVIRDWWHRFYPAVQTPVSHLVMLAPANFGSALAQLGKSKLSRIKAWFDGVEPGQRVLDWLELGSEEAWELNTEWIYSDGSNIGEDGLFPFVVTGQSINRQLYDHVNSYTGELGSDGVVRTSAANLNATYLRLKQEASMVSGQLVASDELKIDDEQESPPVPLRIVHGKSHSGREMGIMKSVLQSITDTNSSETINVIFDCIKVNDTTAYENLIRQFEVETAQVQQDELIEIHGIFRQQYIHDRFSQVMFRVTDTQGNAIQDYDLVFTAGGQNSADHLPPGFYADRQQNSNSPDTVTYYINYDLMVGAPANAIRPKTEGIQQLGLKLYPRPDKGVVRFVPCGITANAELLAKVLKPNATTLIDIIIERVVSKEVFRLVPLPGDAMPGEKEGEFKNLKEDGGVV